jgi:hypothetical protein
MRFRFLLLSLFLLPLWSLTSCGSGSPTDSTSNENTLDPGSNTTEELTVSRKDVVPFSFITIEDASLIAGEEIDVTFINDSGFELVLPTMLVEDGSAKISVPPYIDLSTGNIGQGSIVVSIPGGKQVTLAAEALPELVDDAPGVLLKSFLETMVQNYVLFSGELGKFQVSYGYDTTSLQDAVDLQIDAINDTLNELASTGTLASEVDGEPLQQGDLIRVDQLLYAISKGIYDEVNAGNPAVRLRTAAEPTSVELGQRFIKEAFLEDFGKEASNGTLVRNQALHSTVKTFIKQRGAEFGGQAGEFLAEEGFNHWLDAPLTISRHLIHVSFQGGVNVMQGNGFISDSNRQSLIELLKIADPKQLSSIPDKVSAWRIWIDKNLCSDPLYVLDYELNCSDGIKVATPHTELATAVFKPVAIQSGNEGNLLMWLHPEKITTNISRKNAVFIDWGDGGSDQYVLSDYSGSLWPDVYGFREFKHRYSLPAGSDGEKYYTATVTVTGDNDLNYSSTQTARITVKKELLPLTAEFVQKPTRLSIGEPGFWKATVSGGMGIYSVFIDWKDGNKGRKLSKSSNYGGSHSFSSAGIYEVSFKVSDSNQSFASASSFVSVGLGFDTVYVVWIHEDSRTCCSGDFGGKLPYRYHGTLLENIDPGAIILGTFDTYEKLKVWLCDRPVHQAYNWFSNWAEIGGYNVTNLECDANTGFY